jgi:hypothetical protein
MEDRKDSRRRMGALLSKLLKEIELLHEPHCYFFISGKTCSCRVMELYLRYGIGQAPGQLYGIDFQDWNILRLKLEGHRSNENETILDLFNKAVRKGSDAKTS